MSASPALSFYPIGTPGQRWGGQEVDQWRALQTRQRSYADDVLSEIQRLASRFDAVPYGEIAYAGETFRLVALRSQGWVSGRPTVLVTGGVHGYETSGVHGALRFLDKNEAAFVDRVNLLVVPCVSPWAYERIHRWNFDAIDPNRSFQEASPALESAALMRLVAPLKGQFLAHIDLHETTDTDESEYRPALAARDGLPFEPGSIPDGFYLVDDTENPQPDFQQAIIQAVEGVTHIAPPDAQGAIIGSPLFGRGVIRYAFQAWGLCAGITGARYTTTTEVYPDSPRATPEQCVAAQVAAVCSAIEYAVAQS
ncbi:M14 family metallocarboxypeptidase [Hydrogenophaga sp. PAMC20947]|uniref:M14 family metallopeptidase n=1 Tax=Hydrogenophaga sp. PAMC20947 TaxID=2565558 RepID=UPI00109DD202|nr:M14 family metallocarboxypeptidase [Hydrogenophaga sp. PAMC20947]QCB46315.1 peptidase [Hydrogenophaga sp. PAMC20947]